ncbi:MAG TPA: SEC-C metal-binding domain-containing protein [Clostridia bacterium]|nr:SEC-C metal-binding domain-containing protein [Clostridia bacterium]
MIELSLLEKWKDNLQNLRGNALNEYIKGYYKKEENAYARILGEKNPEISGIVSELAEKFGMEDYEFAAFMDGIAESVDPSIDAEQLGPETEVCATVDWARLYKNMHKAKADWLYNLPEWEGIFDEEKRRDLLFEYRREGQAVRENTVGRNDPCTCGSGKKYKKCCGKS